MIFYKIINKINLTSKCGHYSRIPLVIGNVGNIDIQIVSADI